MTSGRLVFRSMTHYWRTNAAVMLGVAVAVAVLSGALLVGDSVRGSLRDMVLERLGRTDQVVLSSGFMGEQLVNEIRNDPASREPGAWGLAPVILAQGFVSVQGKGGRAGKVLVYGVDARFWSFHAVSVDAPAGREALLSPALSAELQTQAGDTLLIRIQQASDIPLESLHGRKEDATKTIRATVRATLPRESLGEFSLQAQQGEVRAVFLPLSLLQRDLDVGSSFNTLLISGTDDVSAVESLMRKHITLEDLGLSLRELKTGAIAFESRSRLLEDLPANAAMALASEMGLKPQPLFTYLANSMRIGDREVPYSLVTAMEVAVTSIGSSAPIVLNDWAARDLGAKPGDTLSMDYFVWEEPGQLVTRTAEFRVDRIVPTNTGDADMAPVYPGITDASSLRDWDPPFPLDLRRIRPLDEQYWETYVTTPKAFIPLQVGQTLWKSRYGGLTSIRLSIPTGTNSGTVKTELEQRLRERIDPLSAGIAIQSVRAQGLDASRGATNFGEYFVYFSFFLVASALLLSALFFKLNVERRIREVGLLRAVGLSPATVRKVYLMEGLWLSLGGAVLGTAGGVLYAAAIIAALRTWWIGAIGTGNITLHLSFLSVAVGAAGGVIAALLCIAITLRGLRRLPERALLAGQLDEGNAGRGSRRLPRMALAFAALGFLMLIAGAGGIVGLAAGFFGGGVFLLAAALLYFHFRLAKPSSGAVIGSRRWPLAQLGFRNASFRPARSVVAVATLASASFILISVNSFRKGAPEEGFGGYTVLAESLVPIAFDLNSKEGRETLGLNALASVRFEPFRVRPGDDASCLNLYEPKNPRILAPSDRFLDSGRFKFQSSLASTPEEQANPWRLLHRTEPDGAIPVIADANSMTYVLHRKLGADFLITNRGQEVRLRFVAALSDSIFQSELMMSQENFLKLFPEQEGYSLFLIEAPANAVEATAREVEEALADYGVDATSSAARLAEFHRVENTYLSTFQMLGALGLFLGTAGLGAVLLRNILERRRELAMLRTLGYGPRQFFAMTVVENALLLGGGLLIGSVCALLAIAPAAVSEGGVFPGIALSILLGVLLVLGLGISVLATRVALREAVLAALRSE
jgi:putative ABC transport system permease protein